MDDNTKSERSHMHFKNEITLGHVLQMIALGIPIIIWGMSVERRISVIEAVQETVIIRIEQRLERIEDKIDRE